jgi:hypothetical protein
VPLPCLLLELGSFLFLLVPSSRRLPVTQFLRSAFTKSPFEILCRTLYKLQPEASGLLCWSRQGPLSIRDRQLPSLPVSSLLSVKGNSIVFLVWTASLPGTEISDLDVYSRSSSVMFWQGSFYLSNNPRGCCATRIFRFPYSQSGSLRMNMAAATAFRRQLRCRNSGNRPLRR